MITRRKLIAGLGVGTGGLLLGGCDRLGESPRFQSLLDLGEKLTYRVQRGLTARTALAAEFSAADMSPVFRSNGNTMPRSADYVRHLASNFRDWRLAIRNRARHRVAVGAEHRRHIRCAEFRGQCRPVGQPALHEIRQLLPQVQQGLEARRFA